MKDKVEETAGGLSFRRVADLNRSEAQAPITIHVQCFFRNTAFEAS